MTNYTVPSDSVTQGIAGHLATHNHLADAITCLGGANVLNTAYAGGADPSGSADSTAAIQAAVNAVSANGTNKVYFPSGTYKISSSITCGGGATGGIKCIGDGWNSQIFLANASNCYMFDFGTGGGPQFTIGARFQDLYLNCNGANQTTAGGGVYARGAVWCVFDHVWFETPWEAGVRFYQDGLGNFGHHNTIHACLFRDGKNSNGGPGWAVKLEQADENTLSGNTFQDNCNALSLGHDAQVYDTSAGLQSIVGNHFVGGGSGALMIKSDSSPSSCLILGNQFDGPNNQSCIEIDGASSSIIGNKFLFIAQGVSSGTAWGVTLGAVQGNKVIGNSFITTNSTHAGCVQEQSGAGPNIIMGNEANGTFASYFVGASGSNSYISDNIVGTTVTSVSNTAPSAAILTSLGSVSGTAIQLSDLTRDYMVYLEVTTAGTATSLTIGHTSAASDVTLIASSTATLGQLYSFRLPAGWWWKWSGTATAMTNQVAVGC